VENGTARPQTWRFPSRAECLTCHTAAGGLALSFNTRQLNRTQPLPGGTANLLAALAAAGYLDSTALPAPATLPALAAADHPTASLEQRARSYLDANCAACHQPGGTALGYFDARAATPLPLAGLVNGPLLASGSDSSQRVLIPGDPAHSRLLGRISLRGTGQMPPLASTERDLAGESLLRAWINALAEPAPALPASRLANLAARSTAGSGDAVLITGFVLGPGAGRSLLIRAVGPTLTDSFGLPGALTDPVLTVFGPDSSTRVAATNDHWTGARPSPGAAELSSLFDRVGAFRLPVGSFDAALVAQLPPGAYTAQVSNAPGTPPGGIALVEIYDAESAASATGGSRLVNLSVRAQVGTGSSILIPGLVVGPGADKRVLLRAVGPTLALAPFNVSGTLAQPVLTLFAGSQSVARNTSWSSALNAAEIRAATRTVGAFPLPEDSRDCALLVTLPPGAYTLQISGANATSGVALVEAYEVP
jgi:mono/diheme cytochrome c family protein